MGFGNPLVRETCIMPMATVEHARMAVDARIVELARNGDAAAFGQIWTHHRPALLKYARVRGFAADAEDLVSETFTRALPAISDPERFDGRNVGGWLTRILHNLMVDTRKSARSRLETPANHETALQREETHGAQPLHAADETARLVELVETADVRRRVRAAVSTLTAQQCDVIRLRFDKEMSIEETAAMLGLSGGAIKASQYRACRRLAALLTAPQLVRGI